MGRSEKEFDGVVLPEGERKRGQRNFICTGICNAVCGNTSVHMVGPLFLLSLGAEPFHLAVLAALMQASWLGQLVGLKLIPRVGKARMISFGNLVSVIPLGVLIALGLSGRGGAAGITIALIAYGAVALARVTGMTGWWPLLQDITEGDPRGAFFARLRIPLRIVEVTVPLLVGAYLGKDPDLARFALPFLVGALAIIVGACFVRRVPERRVSLPKRGLLLRLRLAGRGRTVRRYLFFVAQFSFVMGLVMPFWVVVLRQQRGLPVRFMLWLVAAAAVGHMAGLKLWGWIVDKHGGRAVLSMALGGISVLSFAWLALPTGGTYLLVWALGYYLLWGFLHGGYHMGRTFTMVGTFPVAYQADGFTLAMLCMFAMAAVGSLVGGLAFRWLVRHPVSIWGFEGPILYLAGVQLCVLGTWWAKHRLVGFSKQTPARELMAAGWKRLIARLSASGRLRP